MPPDEPTSNAPRPPRRERYRGTHPRRFDQRYKELNADAHHEIIDHILAQGRTPAGTHVPVLLKEVMEVLRPMPSDVAADCTLGHGGHATSILERLHPDGVLHGFDIDRGELERTRERLKAYADQMVLHHANFAGLGRVLQSAGLAGFDCILADLGVSSMQIDNPSRGFSFKHDGPLDMRMDPRKKVSAAQLLTTITVDDLTAALRDLSDEPRAVEIARAIIWARTRAPIETTTRLADIVALAVGQSDADTHPAARTFQTLRMLVNDELGALRGLLRDAPYCLKPGGRIAIISFHSGEDRLVKHAFRDGQQSGAYADISDDCIRAGPAERRDNPRSAAAKLRWAVRGGE